MFLSLILAVTLMPLVVILSLLGLVVTWLRTRRTNRDDVVDLVAMQKPVTPEPGYEICISTEPFPQLPSMGLNDSADLMGTPYAQAQVKNYGDLQHLAHYPTNPPMKNGRTPFNTPSELVTTPSKRFNALNESPTREALAAFDFADTPSKPPIPARSLKRTSGRSFIPVATPRKIKTEAPPQIKIEPASPSIGSELSSQDKLQPLHRSPTSLGRAHARQTIEAIQSRANDTKPTPIPSSNPIPFASVPITHIANPTSDDLPPTPNRASYYITPNIHTLPTPRHITQSQSSPPYLPSNTTGMRALLANRSMMEIEAWRPDLQKRLVENRDNKESSTMEVARMLGMKKKSGINMHGKRNSAIREYVRGFPEQNPWRKLRVRSMKDLRGGDLERGDEEFMRRFGGKNE
jgi:hypothetical protein